MWIVVAVESVIVASGLIAIWRLRPYSWGCHYCSTWHARSRTTKGGQAMVRGHEAAIHHKSDRRKDESDA